MELKEIGQLAQMMKENGLTALELTQKDATLKLERKSGEGVTVVTGAPAAPATAQSAFASALQDGVQGSPAMESQEGTVVTSPTVGVFYSAASPDSDPYVEVGSKVKKGDVLCLIEAMKLMNEITAESGGTIAEVCVGNGQVVEYNQPLFRII